MCIKALGVEEQAEARRLKSEVTESLQSKNLQAVLETGNLI